MVWPTRGRQMPPIVHPTNCKVKHHCCEYIVPEIHPTHIQNVTHHNYKHLHSFPVTQSNVDQVTHQNFVAPTPPTQVSPFGPGAPGTVAGAAQPFGNCGYPPRPRRPWF